MLKQVIKFLGSSVIALCIAPVALAVTDYAVLANQAKDLSVKLGQLVPGQTYLTCALDIADASNALGMAGKMIKADQWLIASEMMASATLLLTDLEEEGYLSGAFPAPGVCTQPDMIRSLTTEVVNLQQRINWEI